MFPIRAVQGEVIGFGGRVLGDGEPKYLNSPETPVFVKGRELYGLFEARAALRERGFALVVEGYMDVVALAQHGFANAVATLGTACTAEHVAKLFRFTDSVVFSFDGDAAGQRAAARALEAALPHAGDMRSVRFLFLPGEHDPDSFIRERGAEAFARRVADAIPLSRQLLVQAADGCDLETAEGRARALAQARPLWAALPAGVLKRQLLGELARMAALSDAELARMWGTGGVSARPPRRVAPTARSERFKAERLPADRAAWLLLVENGWWERLAAADHELLCALPGWHGELFRMLDRIHAEQGPLPWAALRAAFGGEWPAAVELVDAADPALEPLIDDLLGALRQLREAPKRAEADRLLGRTF
jgi:DNA primase